MKYITNIVPLIYKLFFTISHKCIYIIIFFFNWSFQLDDFSIQEQQFYSEHEIELFSWLSSIFEKQRAILWPLNSEVTLI